MRGIYKRSGAFGGILETHACVGSEKLLAAAAKIGFEDGTFCFENLLSPISCTLICRGVHSMESFCTSTGFVRAKIL